MMKTHQQRETQSPPMTAERGTTRPTKPLFSCGGSREPGNGLLGCLICMSYTRAETDADSEDTDENTDEGKDGKILPHYHILFRAPKKCTARTMTKRFGGYVQIAQDPFDYARYLTHECFRARKKIPV